MHIKKWLPFLLVAVLLFALAGCGDGKQPNEPDSNDPTYIAAPTGAPDYSAYKETSEFPIGAWLGSHSFTKDYCTYAKEAGITFFDGFRAAYYPNGGVAKRIAYMEETGMKAIVSLMGITYQEYANSTIIDSPAFMGFGFYDEPSYAQFGTLETNANDFITKHPDKNAYINLLPVYSSLGQLGTDSYEKYIKGFVEQVPSVSQLSVDYYPLLGETVGGTLILANYLAQSWLSNMELCANEAKSAGKDLWCFIQTMSYGSDRRPPKSMADITFQNYVNMCYGVKGLQYFCFDTPNVSSEFSTYDYGMLDRNGEPTEIYTFVKEANEELSTFSYAYLQFEWENCMPVYGTKDAGVNFESFDMLQSPLTTSDYFAATADYNALVGQFTDKDGYKGYMLANFSDPLDNQSTNITLTFNANKILVFANGTEEIVSIPEGVYTCELKPGEGRFVVPFND